MKVGKRQQQGREGEGLTGLNPKEPCPACKGYYLKNYYVSEVIEGKRTFVKKGKVCPNENCTFSRKD